MISLIICSRQKTLRPEVIANIEQTIGVEYEIIVIDNSENKYSIFEAYNIGVKQSRYPYLCFMHDDIVYHVKNWGENVLQHLEDEETGVIGIAGTTYVPFMPGSWWAGGLVNQYLLPLNAPINEPLKLPISKRDKKITEVVVLDGVWLCTRKSIFKSIHFDDLNYQGFHFYDIDTCLQVYLAGYKNYCVFDILISHYSKGDGMQINWTENAMIFHNKWRSILPVSCAAVSYSHRCKAELLTLNEYIHGLLSVNVSPKKAYKLAISQLLRSGYGLFYFKTLVYLLKYKYKLLFLSYKNH